MSFAPTSELLLTTQQLGQILLATRKRHKMTQAAIASSLGLSQNRVSHLENHPEELSIKQLLRWCSALELEMKIGVRDTSTASSSAEW